MKDKISRLRKLAQLDVDAIGTYDAALKRVDVPILRDKLSEFRGDHERHVMHLNELIVKLGGQAVTHTPDLKGTVLTSFTAITSMMGNEAALMAMVGNEEVTTHTYQSALQGDWTVEERSLIERHYGDERRHLEWIKHAARSREWARRTEEAHP